VVSERLPRSRQQFLFPAFWCRNICAS
jgi:hypothetical protein